MSYKRIGRKLLNESQHCFLRHRLHCNYLIHLLNAVKEFDDKFVFDIVLPGEEGVVVGILENNEGIEYIRLD